MPITRLTPDTIQQARRVAEEERQSRENELRRQLELITQERQHAQVMDPRDGAPVLFCPFCGSQDIEYTETTWNTREILRLEDRTDLVIDTKDHISAESEDGHLICNDCSTALKIPAALTIEWE